MRWCGLGTELGACLSVDACWAGLGGRLETESRQFTDLCCAGPGRRERASDHNNNCSETVRHTCGNSIDMMVLLFYCGTVVAAERFIGAPRFAACADNLGTHVHNTCEGCRNGGPV